MGIKVWESSGLNKTYDYDMFKYLEYNREIDHVKKVERATLEIGQIPAPIIVNEKNEIIDGQHRFEVWKKLGLPIFYITVPGLSLIQCGAINSASKTWSTKNFVHSYTSPDYDDNESYIYYELLNEEFKSLNATVISTIIAPLYKASGRVVRTMVNKKKIILREVDYDHMRTKCSWFSDLMTIQKKLEGSTENLWEAVSYAYEMEKVDNNRLKKQIVSNLSSLTPVGNFKSSLKTLEAVYNKGRGSSKKIYFDVEFDGFEPKYVRGEKSCD